MSDLSEVIVPKLVSEVNTVMKFERMGCCAREMTCGCARAHLCRDLSVLQFLKIEIDTSVLLNISNDTVV